jgi:hypothetical protein
MRSGAGNALRQASTIRAERHTLMTWLPSTAVRERYRGLKQNKISFRTLDRWVERGLLPPPVYIGGHKYWASEQLDAYDAARLPTAANARRGGGCAMSDLANIVGTIPNVQDVAMVCDYPALPLRNRRAT